jgi:hypothetical protein
VKPLRGVNSSGVGQVARLEVLEVGEAVESDGVRLIAG